MQGLFTNSYRDFTNNLSDITNNSSDFTNSSRELINTCRDYRGSKGRHNIKLGHYPNSGESNGKSMEKK